MHFLVFIPNCQPADLEQRAKAAGLADLLTGHDTLPNIVGPQSEMGIMLAWTSPTSPRHDYSPAEQEWVPSVQKQDGKPVYWVGFWIEKPPTESELRRHYTQAGKLTQFGPAKWKLPTPDTVDARAVYADDGSMRWETVRQFAWMCDEAKQMVELYMEQFGLREMVFRNEPSAQVDWLLKLLRVNYRMLPEVAVHLDLWVGKDHILDTFLGTLGLSRKDSNNG